MKTNYKVNIIGDFKVLVATNTGIIAINFKCIVSENNPFAALSKANDIMQDAFLMSKGYKNPHITEFSVTEYKE